MMILLMHMLIVIMVKVMKIEPVMELNKDMSLDKNMILMTLAEVSVKLMEHFSETVSSQLEKIGHSIISKVCGDLYMFFHQKYYFSDANFGMNFLKSAENPSIAGVPLPWTENQDADIVRNRVVQCAIMDKVHDKYDYYKADGGYQWSEAPGHDEV